MKKTKKPAKKAVKPRFGTVSIAGRPNAGKSTLLNGLLGTKLAIVSGKPQTTRHSIMGVWTEGGTQAVFFDTPGIHKSDTLMNRKMMQNVRASLESRDLLLYVADAHALSDSGELPQADKEALDTLRRARESGGEGDVKVPAFLVLNKIDLIADKHKLLPRLEAFQAVMDFDEFFPVSAKTGEGVEVLKQAIVKRLPEGDNVYDEDYLTDLPERAIAAEVIRERILEHTSEEVPHSVAVLIDKWEEGPKVAKVFATILVEREGQKAIVIGAKGGMLKTIGTEARLQLEEMLGRRFHLQLFVKVRAKWREDESFLEELKWQNTSEVREIK